MLNNHVTSKAEIAKELNLSMPTVLANVNDLLEKMVLEETGEYASTGGRKAKSIGINKSFPTVIPLCEAGYPRVTHPSAAQSV